MKAQAGKNAGGARKKGTGIPSRAVPAARKQLSDGYKTGKSRGSGGTGKAYGGGSTDRRLEGKSGPTFGKGYKAGYKSTSKNKKK